MRGLRIATIAGFEIHVQLGWLLVVAIIAALSTAQVGEVAPDLAGPAGWLIVGIAALGFFGSAVAHDLAHAVVARRRGLVVSAVQVSFFGGATPDEPVARRPMDDLAIAAAGPAVNILLGVALLLVSTGASAASGQLALAAGSLFGVLAILNLLIGGLNLVPAYPLDGGRIVRDIAWRRTGDLTRGWRAAAAAGRLSAFSLIGAGLVVAAGGDITNGAFVAISGWFLFLSARAIRDRIEVDQLIGDLTVGDALERDVPAVTPSLTLDTFAAQLLGEGSPTTVVPVVADERLVGVVGVGQVRRVRPSTWATKRVADVMVRPPRLVQLSATDSLLSGFERIRRARADGLPVSGPDGLLGMLTLRSIGGAVRARREARAAGTTSDA